MRKVLPLGMKDEKQFPEVPLSRADDIVNLQHMDDAGLRLFMAGNQFMAMPELISEFRRIYPDVGEIFCETLPPGLELRQILSGGARFGDSVLTGTPDVYTSVTEEAMLKLRQRGLVKDYFVYLKNRLVLMVARGNPLRISELNDLARDEVRVSQPGELEDISAYIRRMYVEAGGEELARRVMEEKRAEGTTIYTVVHHRETPLRITRGTADVGPVWSTEAVHAKREGVGTEAVEVGPSFDQREKVNYYAARLTDAANPENAEKFLGFLSSSPARAIFEGHGFVLPRARGGG